MCNVWQHPTDRRYEVPIETLSKMPSGLDYLNLTGGEPTLRKDLLEICDVLYPKTATLEISSNGLRPEPLVRILKKYPDIKIRISIEGLGELNNSIRGEKNGFERKIDTMKQLLAVGGCDLGFATTFQDENLHQLLDMFHLSREMGVELATSALHNGFQFHKEDNHIYDRRAVAGKVEDLIVEMLKTSSVKNWFRGYLNMGLIENILGHDRLIPCTAATDFSFVDPWGDVYGCNVRPDTYMGNLTRQTWAEIYQSKEAQAVRAKVAACTQNCWMVASAKTVMRSRFNARLPRMGPMLWVMANKLRVSFGMKVPFKRYIDYSNVCQDEHCVRRQSYLGQKVKVTKQDPRSSKYADYSNCFNR